MTRVYEASEWDRQLMQLRKSLEQAVQETGSLTDPRVLHISNLLDQAVVAQLRAERAADPAGVSGW